MAEIKRYGAAKRFGARYGRKLKQKFAEVESLHKQSYPCPYCSYAKVKRVASGIWQCRKCDAKFTSRAYTVSKKVVVQAVGDFGSRQPEHKQEEPEEEIEIASKKSKKMKAPQEEEIEAEEQQQEEE